MDMLYLLLENYSVFLLNARQHYTFYWKIIPCTTMCQKMSGKREQVARSPIS